MLWLSFTVVYQVEVWNNRVRHNHLARGQLNRENYCFLSPFAPENLVSRDRFGRPVPRGVLYRLFSLSVCNCGKQQEYIDS